MSKEGAVVAVVGIIGVAAVSIASIIVNKKTKKEFDDEKAAFTSAHKIDDMVDKASVENEKIETAEEKATAKQLMVSCKKELESAKTLDSYRSSSDKFLRMYADLTEGSNDKIKANLLYFKKEAEDKSKRDAEAATQRAKDTFMENYYNHDLNKIREVRKVLEAIPTPDAYTVGKLMKGAADVIRANSNASSTAPVTIEKKEVVTVEG